MMSETSNTTDLRGSKDGMVCSLRSATFFHAQSRYPLSIDLIVTRPLIAHLSLYARVKPTCDKKIG